MRRGANLALERLVDVRRPPEAVVQRPSDFAVAIGVRSREAPAPRAMADSAPWARQVRAAGRPGTTRVCRRFAAEVGSVLNGAPRTRTWNRRSWRPEHSSRQYRS